MAVSATGSGFNATILDYKDWLESQTAEDIDELGKNKARLILLNKFDLSDEKYNFEWEKWFKEKLRDTRFDKKNESSFDKFD